MNRSSNAVDGPLSTSIKTTKQEDGSYKAEAVGKTGEVVGPTVARSEFSAVSQLKQNLQKAVAEGKL
jgi:hypothetical protein